MKMRIPNVNFPSALELFQTTLWFLLIFFLWACVGWVIDIPDSVEISDFLVDRGYNNVSTEGPVWLNDCSNSSAYAFRFYGEKGEQAYEGFVCKGYHGTMTIKPKEL